VVIVFVAAYLFREWVIQNTAPNPENEPNAQPAHNNQQQLAQQQATVDDLLQTVRSVNTTDQSVLNEREQTSARLEELRRELLRRRRLIENSNHVHNTNREEGDYDNPYANNSMSPGSAGYNTRFRGNLNLDSDEENDTLFTNPPSGTQSPFASWRDYQQDNSSSSLNHHNMDDQRIASNSTGASRARELSSTDYFAEQLLNETLLEEENDNDDIMPPLPPPPPPPEPIIPPDERNNDAFDFVEDIDGILEAIGMRGNALMMVQNSILMSLMINLCLCVAVWIPYVIGRSVILVKETHGWHELLVANCDP
jgi:E3 ubiquitin-protein ligase MARCH6